MYRIVALIVIVSAIFCQPLAAREGSEPVEVRIIELQPGHNGVTITLRAVDSQESIHMVVGFGEGQSIMAAMRRDHNPRPLTHDLFKSFLERNGWIVDKVLIRAFAHGAFFADLTFEKDHETQVYDARPSDAMALGLRYGAKIYVNEDLFDQQKQNDEESPDKPAKPDEPDTLRL